MKIVSFKKIQKDRQFNQFFPIVDEIQKKIAILSFALRTKKKEVPTAYCVSPVRRRVVVCNAPPHCVPWYCLAILSFCLAYKQKKIKLMHASTGLRVENGMICIFLPRFQLCHMSSCAFAARLRHRVHQGSDCVYVCISTTWDVVEANVRFRALWPEEAT